MGLSAAADKNLTTPTANNRRRDHDRKCQNQVDGEGDDLLGGDAQGRRERRWTYG